MVEVPLPLAAAPWIADIASTGFSAAESGKIRLGDTVAIFAQGPIGLCATIGARLMGASEIYAVDTNDVRLQIAKLLGATATLNTQGDPVNHIRKMRNGRGVDVAIEALGQQVTFENALRVLKPGGILSSTGSNHYRKPRDVLRLAHNSLPIADLTDGGGHKHHTIGPHFAMDFDSIMAQRIGAEKHHVGNVNRALSPVASAGAETLIIGHG